MLATDWLGDRLTDCTGLAAVRVPLDGGSGPREVTLDIPGYLQTNSYGCGAVAAAMVVRYLRPGIAFGRVYDAIGPEPDTGASTTRVVRGLRSCGVRVVAEHRLTFAGFCRAIDQGSPVIVSIHNPGATCGHWVVVYGYSRRPAALYVAGNTLPMFQRNRVPWRQFMALRKPRGNGLICSKAQRPPRLKAASLHK